jgi:hypothetical protein
MDGVTLAAIHHTATTTVVAVQATSKHASPSYLPAKVAAYASTFSGVAIAAAGILAKVVDGRQDERTDRTIEALNAGLEKQTTALQQWIRDYGANGTNANR